MKLSPSTNSLLSLNRTKSFSMYEVRGRIIGVAGILGCIVTVIYMLGGFNDSHVELIPIYQHPVNARIADVSRKTVHNTVQKNSTDIYAVVFDAGSTGSRVHVYQFKSGNTGALRLVKELFEQVKPGLSSYANDPKKGAESLRQLLNIALAEVPSNIQSKTPISLMATAGLRLLQEGVADNLLNEARVLIKEYPFQLFDDGVNIMEGTEEGIYSWMTVSFMTGELLSNQYKTATLDLGGGSTQITFVPSEQETVNTVPKDFVMSYELFKRKIHLYTHSYLGYGLMSTRFKILGGQKAKDEHTNTLKSICLPSNVQSIWTFGGVTYNISGESISSLNSCYSLVRNHVKEKIKPSYELQKHQIYIFSYFFDAAVDSGIIEISNNKNNESDLGGEVIVSDFIKAAKQAFENPSRKKPFLGLDLLYMYSLLHDGYRLRSKTKLHIIKKIKHVEVSWGLGAAFKLLSSAGLIS